MRYRKLPVEVDAIQWTGDNPIDCTKFAAGDFRPSAKAANGRIDVGATLWVNRSRCWIQIHPGTWIIKESTGTEYYPCTADDFRAGFELLGEST